jgi:hypothetical protein
VESSGRAGTILRKVDKRVQGNVFLEEEPAPSTFSRGLGSLRLNRSYMSYRTYTPYTTRQSKVLFLNCSTFTASVSVWVWASPFPFPGPDRDKVRSSHYSRCSLEDIQHTQLQSCWTERPVRPIASL